MGKVIMCCGKLAGKPYLLSGSETKIFSIEELCHYISTNIYSINLSFFSPELLEFIEVELELKEAAEKLKGLIMENHSLNDVITALFCSCDLYDKDEILEIINLVNSLEEMPEWEKKAYIGYKKLEEKKYLVALKYFRGTLKEESLTEKDYGLVLKSMGICLIHVSSFKEAAECFFKAYKYTNSNNALILALLSLKLGSRDKDFGERIKELTEDEAIISKVEQIWKEAEREALNGNGIGCIDNVFNKLKTYKVAEGYKEIELKLEEFKNEYREGALNGLIS